MEKLFWKRDLVDKEAKDLRFHIFLPRVIPSSMAMPMVSVGHRARLSPYFEIVPSETIWSGKLHDGSIICQ